MWVGDGRQGGQRSPAVRWRAWSSLLSSDLPGFRPWSGQGVDQTVDPSREGLGEEALSVCVCEGCRPLRAPSFSYISSPVRKESEEIGALT